MLSVLLLCGLVFGAYSASVKSNVGGAQETEVIPLAPEGQGGASQYPRVKELEGIAGYIQSPSELGGDKPFSLLEYVGKKVILLEFWTYSCINCQHVQPYLNSWHKKYGDAGLLVIGVHTPEFPFEKNYENVAEAVQKAGILYPVVLDNDYATWRSYQNRYWPRVYLIDANGSVVYDHIGEGGYTETEAKIKELLSDL